jgi:hypothetical protein
MMTRRALILAAIAAAATIGGYWLRIKLGGG